MGIEGLSPEQLDLLNRARLGGLTEKLAEELKNAGISTEIINQLAGDGYFGPDVELAGIKKPVEYKEPEKGSLAWFKDPKISLGEKLKVAIGTEKDVYKALTPGFDVLKAIVAAPFLLTSCTSAEAVVYNEEKDYTEMLNKIIDLLQALLDKSGSIEDKMENLSTQMTLLMGSLPDNLKNISLALNAINDTINEFKNQEKDAHEADLAILNAMTLALAQIAKTGKDIDANLSTWFEKIYDRLGEMGDADKNFYAAILGKVDKFDANMSSNIDKLYNMMVQMDQHNQASFQKVLDKMDKISADQLTALNKLSVNIKNMDANMQAKFDIVIGKLGNIEKLSGDQLEMLSIISGQIDKLDAGMLASFGDVITHIDKLGADGKTNFEKLLKAINDNTEAVNNLDGDLVKGIADVLEAIKNKGLNVNVDMSAITPMLDKILAAITKNGDTLSGLSKNVQADLAKILAAIKEGNNIAKGTAETVQLILENMGKLGEKGDTIIDLIKNLSLDVTVDGGEVNVDLTPIKELLEKQLKATQDNGKTLERIEDKLDLMKAVLDQIKPSIDALGKDYTDILQKIYDKIEPCKGHTCDHSEIIILLQQIRDKFGENNDPRHEGILDDLDDIFG